MFQVKARNDAHIALGGDTNHDGKHWEIVLGGWSNKKSVIRKKNQGPEQAKSGGPLNPNALVPMWISWGNHLCVGKGFNVGSNEMMRCEFDYSIPISFMSMCTGWGATGEWVITPKQHKVCSID